jgi:hypothetical protein
MIKTRFIKAVEAFLCNVRPIDRDINWSVSSKLYIAEKLDTKKEFTGRAILAAGSKLF